MTRRLTPVTAVCAAIAAWSLGVFGLSLFGLGAGFGPHPANPALVPPLPAVAIVQGGTRLGPLTDYLEVGQRPLMMPDRRPGVRIAGAAGAADSPLEADLTSVLIAGTVRLAILLDRSSGRSLRVREGELLEGTGWRLQSLQPRRAVFIGPGGEKALDLRVFDGKGGAAPTAPSVAGPSANAPASAGNTPPPARPEPGQTDAAANAQATPVEADQQAQVEEIRRRIEARRAQMRAEAARESAKQDK